MPASAYRWVLLAGLMATGVALLQKGTSAQSTVSRHDAFSQAPKEKSPPDVASYRLSARLDERSHSVRGKGRITFVNPSDESTSKLYFHLYLNAFESQETLYLRGKGGRSGKLKGKPGSIEVLSLVSDRYGSVNLWDSASAHSPGDEKDRTDISVELPEPLPGRATLVLDIEFESKLPEIVERTGYFEHFHLVAQWFPKLAKREPNGRWAHFPFHPHSEFYADFGSYEVELDVPENYVVGSTGRLTELDQAPAGRKRYLARARHVHDFAWMASPNFEVDERSLGDVRVRVLSPPHSREAVAATFDTLQHGLAYLGEKFGDYPYGQLTVVYPPTGAARADGMEYPQFITTGGGRILHLLGFHFIEQVTIHELAHQWFQGMVATNESAYPFLDEGLTSFAEWRYLDEISGSCSMVDVPRVCLSRSALGRYVALRKKRNQPVTLPASKFKSFDSIGALVYETTALSLSTVGAAFGRKQLDEALGDYARTYRFAHPRPNNLFDMIRKHMGKDAETELRGMLERKGDLDLAVQKVETEKRQVGFVSKVVLQKRGTLWLPFEVVARLEDGKVMRKRFEKENDTFNWTFVHESALTSVEIDPNHGLLVDSNLLNNRYSNKRGRPLLASKVATMLAFFLSWIGA